MVVLKWSLAMKTIFVSQQIYLFPPNPIVLYFYVITNQPTSDYLLFICTKA